MTVHDYRAPFWLPGGNAQTLWPLFIKGPVPSYRRERWTTPDDDFIDLDWVDRLACDSVRPPIAPCVVLFHGLEGSSQSHYARALMLAVKVRQWRGVVVHFRGCSGEPNYLARSYHSGDSAEIDWVLRRIKAQSDGPVFAVGVSLGGNVLLKWLGEQGSAANTVIHAAAAVSAPYDLAAANRSLSSGFNLLYARNFLKTLIPRALENDRRFPGWIDVPRLLAARTLGDFDEAVTAPLHGFRDAADYYARSSAKPLLSELRTPTLVLNAANDPFLPSSALPAPGEVSTQVRLELPATGGHVGFVSASLPGNIDWLPRRLLAYFADHIGGPLIQAVPAAPCHN